MQVREAEQWANYLSIDKIARLKFADYASTAAAYWSLYDTYQSLLAAQQQLLEKASQTSLFHVKRSMPFADGAKLSITSDPGVSTFEFGNAYVGGERGFIVAGANEFTLVAQGLEAKGGDPRKVQLSITVRYRPQRHSHPWPSSECLKPYRKSP